MIAIVENIEPNISCSGFKVILKIGERHLRVADTWGDIRRSDVIANKVAKEINDNISAYLENYRKEIIEDMDREHLDG